MEPNTTYTYSLTTGSTNAYITTDGWFFWTNTAAAPNAYPVTVQVKDNNLLYPYPVTSNFTVNVWPPFRFAANGTSASRSNFQFTVTGQSNVSFHVLASTNLMDWSSLYSNTLPGSGSLQINDGSITNFPKRFFRVTYP